MQKMTLNNIHEWPLMTRLLLLGLVFSAAFYAGYRFDLSSQSQALSRAEQQEGDLRQQIEFVIRKSKIIESEVIKLPKLRIELSKWGKQFTPADQVPQVLNQILKIGADNHLFFSLFAPGQVVIVKLPPRNPPPPAADAAATTAAATPPPATPPATDASAPAADNATKDITYAQLPIKVVVVGNYHQLADFISQLANMSSIVVIGDFTVSTDNQTMLIGDKLAQQAAAQHLLTAEMTLSLYHLPESK